MTENKKIPKERESRMYSKEEVLGFVEWIEKSGYNYHTSFSVWVAGIDRKTTTELLKMFIQSLQPKTEEVSEECTCSMWECDICGSKMEAACIETKSKEQPSPSIEKMALDRYPRKIKVQYHSGTVFGDKVDLNEYDRNIFIEGYKANNQLEELEKWVKESIKNHTYSNYSDVLIKINELLKTK